MKVFLSWSGSASHKAALLFRDWLPSVLQNTEPYVSSEDIDKGARWSSDISQELQACMHGIIFITRENIDAPWINFEAGALSKSLDKSRVTPVLIGIKRSDVHGPLLQFQSTLCDKDDIRRLIFTLNRLSDSYSIEEARLANIFDVWWPQLQSALDLVQEEAIPHPQVEINSKAKDNDILEELLELVRNQQKILSDPSQLLPPSYIDLIMNRYDETGIQGAGIPSVVLHDLDEYWEAVYLAIGRLRASDLAPSIEVQELDQALAKLQTPIRYLLSKSPVRRRKTPSTK